MLQRTLLSTAALALLTACAGGTPDTTDVCGNFETSFATLDRFQQPVNTFGTSEVVRFAHTARNKSSSRQTLTASSAGCGGGPVDVKNAAGESIYSSGRDPGPVAACVVSPYEITFEPNETRTYSEDWNTPKSDGSSRNLAAGNYVATYRLGLIKCSAAFDKSANFTLR